MCPERCLPRQSWNFAAEKAAERGCGVSKWKQKIQRIVEFADGIGPRRVTTYAAACAYYLFMSLVPIVVIVCAVLPYTPLTQEALLEVLDEYVPNSLYALVSGIVDYVYEGSAGILSISIILTIWAASSAIVALMRGMDRAYDAERRENYIIFRIRGCFFVVLLILAMIVSLCVMVYGAKILNLARAEMRDTWLIDLSFFIVNYGRYFVVMIMLAFTFALLYKWMPAKKLKLREQWYGAAFTSVSWAAFSAVFSFYIGHSNKYGIYGFLGTIIVAMLWMYYCLYFLLIGAYINRYMEIKKTPSSEKGAD